MKELAEYIVPEAEHLNSTLLAPVVLIIQISRLLAFEAAYLTIALVATVMAQLTLPK